MSFPLFISKKFTLSKKDSRFITLISSISIVGICMGVATLIIALSILEGFEETIRKKIIDFDSHIQISSYQTLLPNYRRIMPNIRELLNPFVEDISPYASNLAIISSGYVQEGVNIKGILPENRSLKLKDNITGYDMKLNNISKIDSLTTLLSKDLRYPRSVRSIYQKHRNIFTWIELQKKPIPIVLGLIIILAVFNIIGSLLMIVLEKTNAIGILKSLGAMNRHISRIFVYQGIFLAMIGIILGNILAYSLMSLQLRYNIISLPSSVYFTSTVPIILTSKIFIGVSLITLILCLTASFIPSYIASRVKPLSSLRFS